MINSKLWSLKLFEHIIMSLQLRKEQEHGPDPEQESQNEPEQESQHEPEQESQHEVIYDNVFYQREKHFSF